MLGCWKCIFEILNRLDCQPAAGFPAGLDADLIEDKYWSRVPAHPHDVILRCGDRKRKASCLNSCVVAPCRCKQWMASDKFTYTVRFLPRLVALQCLPRGVPRGNPWTCQLKLPWRMPSSLSNTTTANILQRAADYQILSALPCSLTVLFHVP